MTFSQLMSTYLGEGTHAARPTTPNVAPGVTCVYYETDTGNTFVWTGSAWVTFGGSATLAGDTDVSISSPASADLLRYDGAHWANYAFDTARYHQAAGTAQSIANNTVTIVNYDTSDWDTNSRVTTGASWKFTATKAGRYSVTARLLFNSSAWTINNTIQLALYKNGSAYSILDRLVLEASVTDYFGSQGSDTITLAATDFIDIRVTQTRGSSTSLVADATHNYVVIAATE